ncbi:uncharacterized protein (TIGR04255 family) [Paraburkholderia sp. MM5496-R1]|uniref:TIGR04255 family protein n=1 Tax=Paraburkholderia sp. MM5496-R1 TaxID=2991065 RepID=UPI003D1C19AF
MSTEQKDSMRAPVKFSRPPVYEVACGVLFSATPPLLTAHIGAYWERIRKEFPNAKDAPPLLNVAEPQGDMPLVSFEFATLPPLRRAWFHSADEQNLIQIQQDRFLFNWKRASESDAYPSYDVVIERFENQLEGFRTFCREVGAGELSFRQFELTYVNHIMDSNGLDVTGLTDLFVDHQRVSGSRFLPPPEGINWTSVYELPANAGRLQILAQSAFRLPSKEKLVRLDLTARGLPADKSDAGRRAWFNLAHEWITRGFADVTNPVLHSEKYWQRTS